MLAKVEDAGFLSSQNVHKAAAYTANPKLEKKQC